jgi:hypothetical protein
MAHLVLHVLNCMSQQNVDKIDQTYMLDTDQEWEVLF